MSSLPESWAASPLADIAHVEMGQSPDSRFYNDSGDGIPFFQGKAEFGKLHPSVRKWCTQPTKVAQPGDILLSVRAPVGPTNIADVECCIGRGLAAIRAHSPIRQDYLHRFFRFIEPWLSQQGTGSTFTAVSGGFLREIEIAIAPLAEQKRIADKLEAVLGRVDACRARLDRVPDLLKRFRQSVLAAATSGQLTEDWRNSNPLPSLMSALDALTSSAKTRRGVSDVTGSIPKTLNVWECPSTWAKMTAAQLIAKGVLLDLKDGNHGSNHPKVSEFTPDGLPFITAAQVRNYRIDYSDAYKVSGKPLAKLRVGFAKSGDVILTHKGTVGRVAIADRDCILTPQTTYYRVNPKWFAPKYLMYFFASPAFGNQLDEIKSQTTRDFVPISQQYALGHLLPPLPEQAEIVRRVEALFALADRIEARLTAARAQVERLTPATLAKAFRGDLVPQDPNDEPASKLLERLSKTSSAIPKPQGKTPRSKAK